VLLPTTGFSSEVFGEQALRVKAKAITTIRSARVMGVIKFIINLRLI